MKKRKARSPPTWCCHCNLKIAKAEARVEFAPDGFGSKAVAHEQCAEEMAKKAEQQLRKLL